MSHQILRQASRSVNNIRNQKLLKICNPKRSISATTFTQYQGGNLLNSTEASSGKVDWRGLTGDTVHGNMKSTGTWRNKPLFRRSGDARFKTGQEASQMLIGEAVRRDGNEQEFITSVTTALTCLGTVFDRSPKYAWIAKQLLEPERSIMFRVAWIDDSGVQRQNRGFRIQYSSSLGSYEGSLHFGHHINASVLKACGFNTVLRNAVTGYNTGAAVGGADFNPFDKSESEIQRFCQSYMTELSKYIGPDQDAPCMGTGVGPAEMGYLYGQYKRLNARHGNSGIPYLGGGQCSFPEATGYGVVHFAEEMLKDRGDSLVGKRCLVVGSGKVALQVASKLLDYGAIPVSFSDSSGHIVEPEGFDRGKLRTIQKIKQERGARVGRYIIASTTAAYACEPEALFETPVDLVFPCATARMEQLDATAMKSLAENGCLAIVEGGHACINNEAKKELKKQGMLYAPHTVTLAGPQLVSGLERTMPGKPITDEMLQKEMARLFGDVKRTAVEFNTRGDFAAGATIHGFLRVANVMLAHGAV